MKIGMIINANINTNQSFTNSTLNRDCVNVNEKVLNKNKSTFNV